MINVTKEDVEFVTKYLKNGKELLKSENVNDILDPLGDLIDDKGFNGYDLNDFGRTAQKVYDRIYFNG